MNSSSSIVSGFENVIQIVLLYVRLSLFLCVERISVLFIAYLSFVVIYDSKIENVISSYIPTFAMQHLKYELLRHFGGNAFVYFKKLFAVEAKGMC